MRKQQTAEIVIIGGGIIGLATARALALRDAGRISVLESGDFGGEASHAAGGMLAPTAEADKADAFFDLARASRDLYPAFAAQLHDATGYAIALDRTGTLYLALNEADEQEIIKRYAWQKQAGLPTVWLDSAQAQQVEPVIALNTRAALFFPQDWCVDNRLLIKALVRDCQRLGITLQSGAAVRELRTENGRVTTALTDNAQLSAETFIVTAGAWSSRLRRGGAAPAWLEVAPVRGQMLCFQAQAGHLRHVVYSPRGYVIPRRDGRIVTGSTTENAGFTKELTLAGVHAVTTHALEIVPTLGALPLVESWAGLRPQAGHGWPVIGFDPALDGLFYATGHYRNGILLAPLTGELVAESVMRQTVTHIPAEFRPALRGIAETA